MLFKETAVPAPFGLPNILMLLTRFTVFFFLKAATLLLLSSSVGMLVQKLGTFNVMEVEEREIKMGGKGVLRLSEAVSAFDCVVKVFNIVCSSKIKIATQEQCSCKVVIERKV